MTTPEDRPLERLLEVQALDTEADQLRHRRASLTERDALAGEQHAVAALQAQAAEIEGPRHELEREQKRIEDEIATVEARIAKEDARLYDGTVTAIKELTAIQDEIAALRRRQDDLETAVLELLEQIEPLDEQLATIAQTRAGHEQRIGELETAIAAAESEIESELDRVGQARSAAAEHLPDGLLGEYETIRTGSGGVGVARLVGGSCGGCHLGLSAVELDRIRREPADAVVHCEECGRILVR